MLFAPEKVGGSLRLRAEHPKLTELQKRLEAAVEQLCSLAKLRCWERREREQSERASRTSWSESESSKL